MVQYNATRYTTRPDGAHILEWKVVDARRFIVNAMGLPPAGRCVYASPKPLWRRPSCLHARRSSPERSTC
jgi:hypothetical protein